MWTPRRVLLLLGGFLLFGGVYGVYSRILGRLDGLPPLPEKMLNSSGSESAYIPRVRTTSPTIERIREAFGPDCLEQLPGLYPTQLEFRNSDNTSTVLASGAPPFVSGSKRIVLAPFSVATFGAPKPAHLRKEGETVEISTFHADKAVLEFDGPVGGPNEMGKAKLLRMELISEPDPARLRIDRRCGTIHITNNQRSKDPNKYVVIRTAGPLFYRDPKSLEGKGPPGAAAGPDIWTDAAVEITDRGNLPRRAATRSKPFRTFSLAEEDETAPVKAAELQSSGPVGEILLGQRLPPPTVTAVGLKIFLDSRPSAKAKGGAKSTGSPFSGIRRMELVERVLVNLWIEPRQELLGGSAKVPEKTAAGGSPPRKTPAPAPPASSHVEPPASLAALGGGLIPASEIVYKLDRALLQVDTLGRLIYDTEKNTLRFDVLPDGNPDLPNDVQAHRIPSLGTGMQQLYSQFLEIEFNRAPVGSPPPASAKQTPAASEASTFKRLRAWVEMPGRIVTLASEPDRLEAYCQHLAHENATKTTTLTGRPLTVVRTNEPRPDGKAAGGNILVAGSKERPATLSLKPAAGAVKSTSAFVEGPGRLDLFDPAANANTIQVAWQTRMSVTKELVDRRELDLFTFVDNASFEDKRADYWLKGNTLKLWMSAKRNGSENPLVVSSESRGALPHRLEASEEVTGHSADFDIERAERLNVWFRPGIPPLALQTPANPAVPQEQAPRAIPQPKRMGAAPPPAIEPPKQKRPMKLKARVIDTWVVRYPQPRNSAPANPGDLAAPKESASGSMKYELEKARFEGKVEVHQDPAEPGPNKRGTDIKGETLLVDQTPDGSVMTVTGADDRQPGEVHNDGMSILGSKIVLNQLANTADVEGRGSLVLPSNTNLNGGELKQGSVVVIHWRDRMKFEGALKRAEFLGKVTAQQNESWVACHLMEVKLDRPMDFSQRGKGSRAGAQKGSPKIESVRCYPAADDLRDEPAASRQVTYHQVVRDETRRIIRTQRMAARELEMIARMIDPNTREPYQCVYATGPGSVRLWQEGAKDEAAPQSPANSRKESAKAPEMKLTIVDFAGRMIARDYSSVYQEVTFEQQIDLSYLPSDRDDLAIDKHRLPPGSVSLTCADKLVVSSYKKPNVPAVQNLRAFGNAYIRSDQYDGWGETVTSEGSTVTLRGGGNTLARINNRFNMNRHSGRVIVYDRRTGFFKVDGAAIGTFEQAPKK